MVLNQRSSWLLLGIGLAFLGLGAVLYGILDAGSPPPSGSVARADAHLGYLFGGVVSAISGMVLVFRTTS